MASTSKARRLVALALYQVTSRSMAAGRSLGYDQLLAETSAEVDVLLEKRRERDDQLLRLARKEILEAQARLAAAVEVRAAVNADRQLADLDTTPGVPSWHPENSQNDII